MAIVTISGVHTNVAKGVILTTWSFATGFGLTSGSIGTPLSAPNLPDKTVTFQITATCTVAIQGSNAATYTTGLTGWYTMNDPGGTALSYATGKIKAILENPRWVRPRVSAKGAAGGAVISIVSQSTKR